MNASAREDRRWFVKALSRRNVASYVGLIGAAMLAEVHGVLMYAIGVAHTGGSWAHQATVGRLFSYSGTNISVLFRTRCMRARYSRVT